jgi:hypothetical protein
MDLLKNAVFSRLLLPLLVNVLTFSSASFYPTPSNRDPPTKWKARIYTEAVQQAKHRSK